MFNPLAHVGPPWAGNQLANYVTELVTACEDRAQELGFDGLTASLPNDVPGIPYEDIFDQGLQATVAGLRPLIAQALQGAWGPEQVQGSATANLMMFGDGGGGFPAFSQAPTAGQYVAWSKFEESFTAHYTSRLLPFLQRGLPGF